MREYMRSYSIRYYVERHYPDPYARGPMHVVESYDSEEAGWAAVDRLNQEAQGCWHILTYVETREVELER